MGCHSREKAAALQHPSGYLAPPQVLGSLAHLSLLALTQGRRSHGKWMPYLHEHLSVGLLHAAVLHAAVLHAVVLPASALSPVPRLMDQGTGLPNPPPKTTIVSIPTSTYFIKSKYINDVIM